jgi:hypothetical protein
MQGQESQEQFATGTKPALQAALFLLLFSAALSLRAQSNTNNSEVDLHVCNKGAVPVEVVAARKDEFVPGALLGWAVAGTTVAPGECKFVYGSTAGLPAYIAFGFADAKGQWGSGKIAQVPDFGSFIRWFHDNKILTGATVTLCAQKGETSFGTDGDLPSNCAGLKYSTNHFTGRVDAPDGKYGPLLPLASALFFETDNQHCRDSFGSLGAPCSYYLNISPSAASRELNAKQGTASGEDEAKGSSGDSLGTQVLKAIAKSAAEEGQKQAQRKAQTAAAAPTGGFKSFEQGCNAFYDDPANARLSMSDSAGWCACLSKQYRSLMSPEEEAKYANDYQRLFHGGIAQPWGYGLSKSDPAWPRLHPAVDKCQR